MLVAFGLYEWKGTKTGILHHELFRSGKARGRTFALCAGLLFLEAILIFSYGMFTPIMSVRPAPLFLIYSSTAQR